MPFWAIASGQQIQSPHVSVDGCCLYALLCAVVTAANVKLEILPLALAFAVLFTFVLHLLSAPFRITPPDELSTFGALARRVAGVSVATKQLHLGSTDAVLNKLRPIVVDTLGVDRSAVVLTARFIEDLGMG